MPWMQTSATEQRLRFAEDFESGQWSMTELRERYGVTRPTGYKWVGRFREAGGPGMTERSRAPHACPHRTPAEIEALILTARLEYGGGCRRDLEHRVLSNAAREDRRENPPHYRRLRMFVNDALGLPSTISPSVHCDSCCPEASFTLAMRSRTPETKT